MSSSLKDQLQSIHSAYGKLTSPIVVSVARNPQHPLHNRFEWDDTVAGEKYREVQAGALIRSVRITRAESGAEDEVRAFIHVKRAEVEEEDSYEPIELIAADPVATASVLQAAEREWKMFKAKYQHLKGFIEMIQGDLAA